jgi:hypothetical protein
MTVFGETNNTNVPIQFTSSQELTTPASGQARIEESSGDPLLNIMVLVPDGFYESLIFNANGDGDGTNMDPSMITIEVLDNMGETTMATFELGNGSNFFTITTDALQSIVKTTITSDLGWDDLRQVRIGGARTIPEPSSIALGFIGTVGLVLFRRAGRNLGKR